MEDKTVQNGLIEHIIELEAEMFINVKAAEPAACQQMLGTFKRMRNMSHSVLSEETLKSYLDDLIDAKKIGRNLMTEKYARMDNLIPPLSTNPLIEEIVDVEIGWMELLQQKYPLTVNEKGGFKNYMKSELETYSDNTMRLYYRDIMMAKTNGINLVAQRYINLYCGLGFKSLDEVEETARKRRLKEVES